MARAEGARIPGQAVASCPAARTQDPRGRRGTHAYILGPTACCSAPHGMKSDTAWLQPSRPTPQSGHEYARAMAAVRVIERDHGLVAGPGRRRAAGTVPRVIARSRRYSFPGRDHRTHARFTPTSTSSWPLREPHTRRPRPAQLDLAVAPRLLGCRGTRTGFVALFQQTAADRAKVIEDADRGLSRSRPGPGHTESPPSGRRTSKAVRYSSDIVIVTICIEHLTMDQKVGGSSPFGRARSAGRWPAVLLDRLFL